MNFFEHLEEFRKRILHSILFFILTYIILWFVKDDLVNLYLIQLNYILQNTGGGLILLNITDKFFIHLKTVAFFSIILTLPVIYYESWKFLSPALFDYEKKYFVIIFLFSLSLFYIGILSAYYILIPVAFKFLANYSVSSSPLFITSMNNIKLLVSLSEQIYITQTFILIFALIFQTPLIVLCFIKTDLIKIETVKNYRKHIIIICFLIAAILTPPDAVSMTIMAIPLIFLFEIGLILNSLISNISKNNEKNRK